MGVSFTAFTVFLIAGLFASIASACTFQPGPISGASVFRGEDCTISYQQGVGSSIGLEKAENLGTGFVWQVAYDGNVCVAEQHAVLIDCNAGRAVTVGPYEYQGNEQGSDHVYAVSELRAFVRDGIDINDLTLEIFAQKGGSLSLPDAVYTDLRNRISLNGQLLGLSCACRLYYPDSAGARN
jgi:hypothetical protein